MKIPLSWIRRYTDIDAIRSEINDTSLAHTYSIRTAEIDDIIHIGVPDSVVVGKIESVRAHSDSDRLNVVTLHTDKWDPRQIVCGAPNVRNAHYVAVALPGTKLREDLEIQRSQIRGETSDGMICSLDELSLADERAEGILILEECIDETTLEKSIGKPVFDLTLPFPGRDGEIFFVPLRTTVFEIDNKFITNRPDLFSVEGNAREFAAIFRQDFIADDPKQIAEISEFSAKIETDAVQSAHFMLYENALTRKSVFDGVTHLLHASGIATKYTHVDITNAIMTELGQPMHAFDYEKVRGMIRIRKAHDGETIDALNGKTYTLTPDDVVIADDSGPISIAGIMGGMSTAVTESTTRVVYEAVCFDATTVRRTAQRLGIRTDASTRYEKSLDPLLPERATRRLGDYMQFYGYDRAPAKTFHFLDTTKLRDITVSCSHAFLTSRIGADISPEKIHDILVRLWFGVTENTGNYEIRVPSWRATKDVDIPEDIVEEIARHYGYEHIEPVAFSGDFVPIPVDPLVHFQHRLREFFCGKWVYEVYTRSFSYPALDAKLWLDPSRAIAVANAYSEEASLMRRTAAGMLFCSVADNMREYDEFAFYDIGKSYFHTENDNPSERIFLSAVFSGWSLKGLRTLIDDLAHTFAPNIPPVIREDIPENSIFHPNKSARLHLGDTASVSFGRIHPERARAFEISTETLYLQIDIALLLFISETSKFHYSPIIRFPTIDRELDFIMDARTPTGDIEREILDMHELIRSVSVIDVYEDSDRIETGKKSVSFRIRMQEEDGTITDEQALAIQDRIVSMLSVRGILLRT